MEFTLDKFNGIIIDPTSVPHDTNSFNAELNQITEFSKQNNKGIIWISLAYFTVASHPSSDGARLCVPQLFRR